MDEGHYGKLILTQTGEPEQEFLLAKSQVNLGRATTNDIILTDDRVSRTHARLSIGPGGLEITDLGSSNGTRLNGNRIQSALLQPGDVIGLGNSQLRFEAAGLSDEAGMTLIDSEAELARTIDQEILPMALNETGVPRLVIFTDAKTWEISLADLDSLTIGRSDANEIYLDDTKASRKHAEVKRLGDTFVLHDLGSTNGTLHKGGRVTEMALQDGDAFQIGSAQLVFKSGFAMQALTLADEALKSADTRRPVIFVPGSMGSELWLGNERLWPNVKTIFTNPEIFRYPSDIPLEARSILQEVVIVPNLIKQDQYNRLGDYLVEELGYERGKNFFEFPYDWRQDVRVSARQLGEWIETLPISGQFTIIAHSLGTMVSRYYIERLGGKKRIQRIMLLGGPHQGSVKILTSMLIAPQVLPFGIMGERMRQLVLTFPSSYQIIPTYACGVDQNGIKVNFLEDESWLDEVHRPLLRAGKQFRQELGRQSSIPALSIFGYGIKTHSIVAMQRDKEGKVTEVTYKTEPSGDSTILEKSAVLDGSDIHPVQQYHGSLFVDNDVKMRLKIELARWTK